MYVIKSAREVVNSCAFFNTKEGDMVRYKLLTKWIEKELVCCCPICSRCLKDHGCEELDFTMSPFDDTKECMRHDSYKRTHGAIRQTR